MKRMVFLLLVWLPAMLRAQTRVADSAVVGFELHQLPTELQKVIDTQQLRQKAVVFFLNESLHPLGKRELLDGKRASPLLEVSLRMGRCTLAYADTGMTRFHTIYQRNEQPMQLRPGRVYAVVLLTHMHWLIPYIFQGTDKEGNERAPVLLYYISPESLQQLWQGWKNKEVVMNER